MAPHRCVHSLTKSNLPTRWATKPIQQGILDLWLYKTSKAPMSSREAFVFLLRSEISLVWIALTCLLDLTSIKPKAPCSVIKTEIIRGCIERISGWNPCGQVDCNPRRPVQNPLGHIIMSSQLIKSSKWLGLHPPGSCKRSKTSTKLFARNIFAFIKSFFPTSPHPLMCLCFRCAHPREKVINCENLGF